MVPPHRREVNHAMNILIHSAAMSHPYHFLLAWAPAPKSPAQHKPPQTKTPPAKTPAKEET
jgi:hypothetical protein